MPDTPATHAPPTTLELLKARLRETPLLQRLRESQSRIGKMCSEGRCPSMSIPVRETDDDFFISNSIADAIEALQGIDATMLADAIDIADHTARSDIECFFLRNEDGWYNLSAGMPYDWLPQILRYLTARGLIERKTGDKLDADLDADLVRFVKRA